MTTTDPKLIERASLIAEQAYSAGNLVTCDGYYEFDLDAAAAIIAAAINEAAQKEALQPRVAPWLEACFGSVIAGDRLERCDRFIEEALELAQTNPAFTADRAHALVDYVFGRPVGEPSQEVGGVMITLAALCLASSLDMHEAGETELARIWTKVGAIRAKQAAKPTGSALPIAIEAKESQHGK